MQTQVGDAIAEQREEQLRWMDDDEGRAAQRYIWHQDDMLILAAARSELPGYAMLLGRLRADHGEINPLWMIGACAADAYERGIMAAEEMDSLLR